MGNKLVRRRQVVDEQYTKPQGLYHHKDVDHKKLRKLILESKLAPCYPGDEESCSPDLEECPICFLYYPSLNRSRCCTKSICTECFLQMKVPNTPRPTQCPFCKMTNYGVEYRGGKTKEEKGRDQIEEQRVIEAKIRMRQQELQDEEERMQKRQEICSLMAASTSQSPAEDEEVVSLEESSATSITPPPPPLPIRANRDDEFDLDLEDIMVMEAIWLSIQEKGKKHQEADYNDVNSSNQYASEEDHQYISPSTLPLTGPSSSSSVSRGLACSIAALAEHQHMGAESSSLHQEPRPINPPFHVGPRPIGFFNRMMDRDPDNYPTAQSCSNEEVDGGGPEVGQAGTSYGRSSDANEDGDHGMISSLGQDNEIEHVPETAAGSIIPGSYDEQMMLAMAVSLAEARATTSGPGVSWK